jgi:hypothetical protein
MMEQDFSDSPQGCDTGPGATAALKASRYDFEVPQGLQVSDLLTIQIAECARLVRNLTDSASNPHLMDIERLRMVDQLKDIVGASSQLSQEINRLQTGAPLPPDDICAHTKRRKT